eukprot:Gb_33833 [translate_table: standard]
MEETVKLFSACDKCSEMCKRKLAKGDPAPHVPSFCTFLLSDFSSRLKIPREFVDRFEAQLREDIILEGPSGQIWLVNLDADMTLVKGWDCFVSDHSLETGDFLVFTMVNASFFKVHIYGKEGGEKRFTVMNSEAFT